MTPHHFPIPFLGCSSTPLERPLWEVCRLLPTSIKIMSVQKGGEGRYCSFVCQQHYLNTGVVLDVVIGCGPGVPVGASVIDVCHVLESGDLRLALDQLQSETLVGVPCNVTYGRKRVVSDVVPTRVFMQDRYLLQCIIQAPGLSVIQASASQPSAGSMAVSRRGALTVVSVSVVLS